MVPVVRMSGHLGQRELELLKGSIFAGKSLRGMMDTTAYPPKESRKLKHPYTHPLYARGQKRT